MLFFEILWWMQALRHDYFSYFPSGYLLSITMIFGATVAGMTSEGGGAVAFPVMTLALGIAPSVARDFSLMIQSCGMTAAAFTIFWMRIKLEKHSLIFCSTGAFAGMILGKRCGSVSDCSTLIGRELQSVYGDATPALLAWWLHARKGSLMPKRTKCHAIGVFCMQ